MVYNIFYNIEKYILKIFFICIIFFTTFPILLLTIFYSLIMYYEYYCMEDYTDCNKDCNVIKSIILYYTS